MVTGQSSAQCPGEAKHDLKRAPDGDFDPQLPENVEPLYCGQCGRWYKRETNGTLTELAPPM